VRIPPRTAAIAILGVALRRVYSPECEERLSGKSYARANLLTISLVIAA